MAEIYKGVFEDDKGNRYYAASDTEITYDTAGIPLNNGGDLSEASVNFTVSSSRKALTAKARFKSLMGDIAKWLTDLGPAAFYKVADDFTTTAENYLFTARKGKQLKDEVDNLNQNLGDINSLLAPGITNLSELLQYWIDGGYLSDPIMRALVPILSGADSKIITDSKNTNYPMWQVYDNNMVTAGIGATYIGFDFSAPVCVRRIEWQGFNSAYTGFGKNSHIQASVNGSEWINVYEFDGGNSYNSRVVNAFANSQSYRYWRVQNGAGAVVGLASLQFYGK